MKHETTESILISELNALKKSVQSSERIRFALIGIYGSLLKSKVLFKNNPDIRPFVDKLPLHRPVKDYLLKARPQIIARLITEISDAEETSLEKFVMEASKLVESANASTDKTVPKISTSDNTIDSSDGNDSETKKRKNYIDNLLDKYSRKNDQE